ALVLHQRDAVPARVGDALDLDDDRRARALHSVRRVDAAASVEPDDARRAFERAEHQRDPAVLAEARARRDPGAAQIELVHPAPPAGVPVMLRSPGMSVIAWLTNATTSRTPKIWFDVFESCIVSPFRTARIGSACGSGTSLAGTRSLTGRNVSSDLPRTHCPSEN